MQQRWVKIVEGMTLEKVLGCFKLVLKKAWVFPPFTVKRFSMGKATINL